MTFSVTFWGVRGTIPCAIASHMGYGGNTSCLEVTADSETIILDAGTGIRMLGQALTGRGVQRASLLFSHTHLDHISGFPFFSPAFTPGFNLQVLAGHLKGNHSVPDIRTVLAWLMQRPLFPVPLKRMGSNLSFDEICSGETFKIGDAITVHSRPLNHPDGATGYRIEYQGRSLAYVTDTEHVIGRTDQNVVDLMQGADLVVYDSTYTEGEFRQKVGWGHSTWQEAVRLANIAQCRRLALFHHEPNHDDVTMDRIEREAQAIFSDTFAAREGTTITL